MYSSSMAKVEHDTRTHAYQRRRFVILLYLLAITLLMTITDLNRESDTR